MPGWFHTVLSSNSEATPTALGVRVGVALLLGLAVAGIYRWAHRGESVQATFPTTLALLAILIAMATQIIGDNVARAFSLVGALSVVRFRTVVKDTQDTAFVILAVVVGMSAGANHLAVGLVGLAVVIAASPLFWPPGRRDAWLRSDGTLTLRVGQPDGRRSRWRISSPSPRPVSTWSGPRPPRRGPRSTCSTTCGSAPAIRPRGSSPG